MGGKVWSAEEEKFFWEVIVPQAPAGLDAASKQAKKDAHIAWAPLSRQMEREMVRRLKPEERPRRKYTPIGCYEHYFQNYINRHYSPHAKGLVLKYQACLRITASSKSPQPTTVDEASSQLDNKPVPDPSRPIAGATAAVNAFHRLSHSNGATVPMQMQKHMLMPEAPMFLTPDREDPSSMQVLCDAALAVQANDSYAKEKGDRNDTSLAGSSRKNEKKPASAVLKAAKDEDDADDQHDANSEELASRGFRNVHRTQRRARKVAYRQAQASDEMAKFATPPPSLPPPDDFHNDHQPGYYNGAMMYGHQPGYFAHYYGMQPMGPPLHNANAFQSNSAVQPHGFYPYGGPPRFGGYPQLGGYPPFGGFSRFDGPPPPGVGGPFLRHGVPYLGGYFNSGVIPGNTQGFGNSSVNGNRGMGGYGSVMGGNGSGEGPASGLVEEETYNSGNK